MQYLFAFFEKIYELHLLKLQSYAILLLLYLDFLSNKNKSFVALIRDHII